MTRAAFCNTKTVQPFERLHRFFEAGKTVPDSYTNIIIWKEKNYNFVTLAACIPRAPSVKS